MRILVTGAGGQVGREFAEYAAAQGDEIAGFAHGALDVTDRDAVATAVGAARPDVVVHTAAWTAVDACESDAPRADRVNGGGTANVVAAARAAGAHLVYLSTD